MLQPEKLERIFDNNFNCYADTNDESVVMAMDKEQFVAIVMILLQRKEVTTANIDKVRANNLLATIRNNSLEWRIDCGVCGVFNHIQQGEPLACPRCRSIIDSELA